MNSNPPSLISSIWTYIWVFILLGLLIGAILWAVETFTGVAIEASSVGWIPTMVTAMQVGQRYGKLAGTPPSGGHAWAAGFWFTVVNVVLSVAVLAVAFVAMGRSMPSYDEVLRQSGATQADLPLIAAIIGGVLLLIWVLLRFAFSFGARQGIKMAERTAKA